MAFAASALREGRGEQSQLLRTHDEDPLVSPPWFAEEARIRGVHFTHDSGHQNHAYLLPESVCGGGALFDMDNDGDLDLYLLQDGPLTGQRDGKRGNRLYENSGDGTFIDVTQASGAGDQGYAMSVATGDYDNDGDVDLYITNVGPNTLLNNNGHGRFTPVTKHAGVGDDGTGSGAAFLDYDRDGDLDLFILNYVNWTRESELDCFDDTGQRDYCAPMSYHKPTPDVLYRNNGDSTFTDVTTQAGMAHALGTGLGITCADFNGDAWVDIFVANDGMFDRLWINQKDGTFVDNAIMLGCAADQEGKEKAGMGVDAIDVDADTDMDLLVVNLGRESDSFFVNTNGFFMDQTARTGLAARSRRFTRFGVGLIDFDNDGVLDLYQANGRIARDFAPHREDDLYAEPNLLLQGKPGLRFEEVSPRGGATEELVHTSRAAIFGDIDNDGGVDIVVVNRDAQPYVLHNTVPGRRNWALLRIVNEHGSDALGAEVTVNAGVQQFARTVRTAYSYFAANDPRIHVGLGDVKNIECINVRWSDGTEESFGPFKANAIHTLRRGSGSPSPQ